MKKRFTEEQLVRILQGASSGVSARDKVQEKEGVRPLYPAQCLGHLGDLGDVNAFAEWLQPLRRVEWVVYAKPLRRAAGGARLPLALHPPDHHRQQPPDRL